MKFSSISTMRLSASALVLAATVFLGISGIANAQSGSAGGQKPNPADHSDKKDPIEGHTGEGYGGSSDKSKADSTKGGQKDKAYKQTKENPAEYSDKNDPVEGRTGEGYGGGDKGKDGKGSGSKKGSQAGKHYEMTKDQKEMDTGYVDQKKRDERNKDAASPSSDTHVPDFQKDKEGRPMKDPKYEQGGPIGPN
jgi:uncharacterized low-complexity protein